VKRYQFMQSGAQGQEPIVHDDHEETVQVVSNDAAVSPGRDRFVNTYSQQNHRERQEIQPFSHTTAGIIHQRQQESAAGSNVQQVQQMEQRTARFDSGLGQGENSPLLGPADTFASTAIDRGENLAQSRTQGPDTTSFGDVVNVAVHTPLSAEAELRVTMESVRQIQLKTKQHEDERHWKFRDIESKHQARRSEFLRIIYNQHAQRCRDLANQVQERLAMRGEELCGFHKGEQHPVDKFRLDRARSDVCKEADGELHKLDAELVLSLRSKLQVLDHKKHVHLEAILSKTEDTSAFDHISMLATKVQMLGRAYSEIEHSHLGMDATFLVPGTRQFGTHSWDDSNSSIWPVSADLHEARAPAAGPKMRESALTLALYLRQALELSAKGMVTQGPAESLATLRSTYASTRASTARAKFAPGTSADMWYNGDDGSCHGVGGDCLLSSMEVDDRETCPDIVLETPAQSHLRALRQLLHSRCSFHRPDAIASVARTLLMVHFSGTAADAGGGGCGGGGCGGGSGIGGGGGVVDAVVSTAFTEAATGTFGQSRRQELHAEATGSQLMHTQQQSAENHITKKLFVQTVLKLALAQDSEDGSGIAGATSELGISYGVTATSNKFDADCWHRAADWLHKSCSGDFSEFATALFPPSVRSQAQLHESQAAARTLRVTTRNLHTATSLPPASDSLATTLQQKTGPGSGAGADLDFLRNGTLLQLVGLQKQSRWAGNADAAVVLQDGPFDHAGGRKSVRSIQRVDFASLPRRFRYRPCRTLIMPPNLPELWDPSMPSRSATMPGRQLVLEFVYGYSGSKHRMIREEQYTDQAKQLKQQQRGGAKYTLPSPNRNLFFVRDLSGSAAEIPVVFPTASLGVTMRVTRSAQEDGTGQPHEEPPAPPPAQRFFQKHDGEISCLCIDSTRSLVATGQCGGRTTRPFICVWDARSMQQLAEVGVVKAQNAKGKQGHGPVATAKGLHTSHKPTWEQSDTEPFYERAVVAVAFSTDGRWLAAVGADDMHTIALWKWKSGKLLAHAHTQVMSGIPPQVYGIDWCPLHPRRCHEGRITTDFITVGEGHIKFWKYSEWEAMEDPGSHGYLSKPAMADSGTLSPTFGRYGANKKAEQLHPVANRTLCSTFVRHAQLDTDCVSAVTGGDNGRMYVWDVGTCTVSNSFVAHGDPRGSPAALTAVLSKLENQVSFIYSGGADGRLCKWLLGKKRGAKLVLAIDMQEFQAGPAPTVTRQHDPGAAHSQGKSGGKWGDASDMAKTLGSSIPDKPVPTVRKPDAADTGWVRQTTRRHRVGFGYIQEGQRPAFHNTQVRSDRVARYQELSQTEYAWVEQSNLPAPRKMAHALQTLDVNETGDILVGSSRGDIWLLEHMPLGSGGARPSAEDYHCRCLMNSHFDDISAVATININMGGLGFRDDDDGDESAEANARARQRQEPPPNARPGDSAWYGGAADAPGAADSSPRDRAAPLRAPCHTPLFVSASKDGQVMVWDAHARSRRLLASTFLQSPPTAVAVCVAEASGGGAHGSEDAEHGAFALPLLIAAGCEDGSVVALQVLCISGRAGEDEGGNAQLGAARFYLRELATVRHSEAPIADLKFSPDGHMLASANRSRSVEVFGTAGKWPLLATCLGASSVVTHVDWSRDSQSLQGACADGQLLFWQAQQAGHGLDFVLSTEADLSVGVLGVDRQAGWGRWHTWTVPLGFPVMGIWEDSAEITRIASVDSLSIASPKRTLGGPPPERIMVTGDSDGTVRLLNFPCIASRAPSRKYVVHR
jgi:WD40 repeat protein